jgi:hypothetical protein
MPRSPSPPHFVKKRRGWYARLSIPAAVRHAFGGRKTFMTPLHETDRDRAYIKSVPMIAEWRQGIAAAKSHQGDLLQSEITRLAAAFRKAIGQHFSKMKARMGYDTVHTLHSLRHCFAHMLSKARVPMHQIKDLPDNA